MVGLTVLVGNGVDGLDGFDFGIKPRSDVKIGFELNS